MIFLTEKVWEHDDRYLGQIEKYGEVEWVGIEWDEEARGRGDGTVDGCLYFKVEVGHGASFVKREKIGNGGRRSFVEALRLRYHIDKEAQSGVVGNVGKTQVELVGMEKEGERQGRWKELNYVSLRGLGVCCVGNDVKLDLMLPQVQQLDLGECLFDSFETLFDVVIQLPKLVLLDVSRNKFNGESFETFRKGSRKTHCGLRTIVFNETNLKLADCVTFVSQLPNVSEIRLHRSNLSTLAAGLSKNASEILRNLITLDLHGNDLSWEALTPLYTFPHLKRLLLGSNKITSICVDSTNAFSKFNALDHLNLDNNSISKWDSIVQLQQIENLRSLRIRDNPLTLDVTEALESEELNPKTPLSRIGIIARIPQLCVLEGSKILKDEREYAENMYLKDIFSNANRSNISTIMKEHPLFLDLCKRYDFDPEKELRERTKKKDEVRIEGTISAELVSVRLVRKNVDDKVTGSTMRKLPLNTEVYKIKGLFPRIFRVKQQCQHELELVRMEMEGKGDGEPTEVRIQMDDEYRRLKDYRVSDDCEIVGREVQETLPFPLEGQSILC